MTKQGSLHVGTSGLYYDHGLGPFYPADLGKENFLKFYAGQFRTVEINNSFYHLPMEITADFVYARLHGPGKAYQGKYAEGILHEWAQKFSRWRHEGKDIYCYFDNDQAGYAAQDARRLNELLEAA